MSAIAGADEVRNAAPRIGPGDAPAVLLVDFACGWTDPASPMHVPCAAAVEAARRLLDAARAAGLPVAFTTVAYEAHELDTVLMLRKAPRVRSMTVGSPLTQVDPRLAPAEGELVVVKKHASAFFGTTLHGHLAKRGIDTLLIGGCITSGCVRATAIDAAQHGLRALVVRDATADRVQTAADESLRVIDSLYGDVISLSQAVGILGGSR